MTFSHANSAVLDYSVDWTAWLATGETLTASTWTVPAGITQTTPTPSYTAAGVCTIWLTGGTTDTYYQVTNHVTTSVGRQDERTITLRATNR